jgi:alpha-N-arabinofuranosidase
MGAKEGFSPTTIPCLLLLFCLGCKCLASELQVTQTATVKVDASPEHARKIPDTLFGVFFEEINHAGAGGIWAELVSNRGIFRYSRLHPVNFRVNCLMRS